MQKEVKPMLAKDSQRLIVLDGTERKLNLFPDILLRALGLIAMFTLTIFGILFGIQRADEIDAWFTMDRQLFLVGFSLGLLIIRLAWWGYKKLKEN
jgi:hypothetical protein